MPEPVETTDPEGVDFAWVMQTTFVLTILLGAPVVALASISVSLPTWGARASFAIRVGAIIWIVVACGTFLYERRSAARRTAGDRTRREPVRDRDNDGDGDGDESPTRGGDENRTGSDRDDAEDRRDDDRGDTRRGDASTLRRSQSASESSSDT